MNVIQVTEENLEDFRDIIPEDIAENLSRQPYHCIALEDDNDDRSAALVWEFKHLNDVTRPTISRLSWVYAGNPDAGNDAFSEYGSIMGEVEARKSVVLMPEEDGAGVTDILAGAGFDLKKLEGEDLIVTVGMLSELDILKKGKIPDYLGSVETLTSRPFRRGLMNCIFHTKRDKLEDLSCLPLEWFEPEVSCYVQTDEKITGMLLVHRCISGRLRVEFMSAIGPDGRKDLLHMMKYSILQAVSAYPADTEVIIPRRDAASRKLAGYFFPDRKGETCLFGERTESEQVLL